LKTLNSSSYPIRMEEALDSELRADLKKRILLDIKHAGRRLGADQMRVRYQDEGDIARAVIDELADKGILLPDETRIPKRLDDIIHAVSSIEYGIEDQVRQSLREVVQDRRSSHREFRRDLRSAYREASTELRDANPSDSLEEYETRIRKERNSARAGFTAHAISFIAVNGFLMSLNAAFSPAFPWALIPFGGWGIGLLGHLVSLLRKQEQVVEFNRIPHIPESGIPIFKRLQKSKNSFWQHFSSTVSTSAFLIMLNGITMRAGPSFFPWAAIPVFFMGIGLLTHSFRYAAQQGELKKALKAELINPGFRMQPKQSRTVNSSRQEYGPYAELVSQAYSLREAIAAQVALPAKAEQKKEAKKKDENSTSFVDHDLLPTLDSYVEQVCLLAKRTYEVDKLMELIPMADLQKDKKKLLEKRAQKNGIALQKEYEKSVAEIERQETSYIELSEQHELMELRIQSSVNTLKQMRIDLARLAAMDGKDASGSDQIVIDKTAELNRYLADLRAAYSEIDSST